MAKNMMFLGSSECSSPSLWPTSCATTAHWNSIDIEDTNLATKISQLPSKYAKPAVSGGCS